MSTEKRLGFVGIVVEKKDHISDLNKTLNDYSYLIRGRIGVPDSSHESGVIGLIVEGTNDELGAMTGKLGNFEGIQVKSALLPRK